MDKRFLFVTLACAGVSFANARDEPRATDVHTDTPIIVQGKPWTIDDLITNGVLNQLLSDRGFTGRIAIETEDRRVTLSGMVQTPGQARRAVQSAHKVSGVEEVRDQLRAYVGGRPGA